MNLNGSIINGIFAYIPGIQFTTGDILLADAELYVVLTDYDGAVHPKESSDCISYIKYHEYSAENTGVEAIVTAGSFFNILRSYFKGLTGNGHLEKIEITELYQLDDYKDTGAYDLTVIPNELAELPAGNYLMKVFSTKEGTIQEFDEYTTGNITFRNIESNKWSIIPGSDPKARTQLSEHFTTLVDKVRNVVNNALTIQRKSFNFQKVDIKKENNSYIINDLPLNTIIHLIIINEHEGGNLQYTKSFYLSEGTRITYEYLYDEDKITLDYGSNQALFTFNKEGYKIQTAYISKGRDQ